MEYIMHLNTILLKYIVSGIVKVSRSSLHATAVHKHFSKTNTKIITLENIWMQHRLINFH